MLTFFFIIIFFNITFFKVFKSLFFFFSFIFFLSITFIEMKKINHIQDFLNKIKTRRISIIFKDFEDL